MAQVDDSGSLNGEGLLKRKAISEIRLQDPKLWSKILWIRKHFVKDDNTGVRKVDFYNFVTEHLGRTGYRDVWHLLKMAYPHVDRVRRGRKYMYWGISHVDRLKSLSSRNDDGQEDEHQESSNDGMTVETGLDDKEQNNENKTLESQSSDECNNNGLRSFTKCDSNQATGQKLFATDDSNSGSSITETQSPKEDLFCSSNEHPEARPIPGIVVKTEQISDDEDEIQATKNEHVVVMEFKEKDVFESFEDYEKSKSLEEKDKEKYVKNISESRNNNTRSVSPPIEIFSENQISPELPASKQFSYLSTSKSEEENYLRGNKDSNSAVQEKMHLSFDEKSVSKNDTGMNDIFAPNLLEPENINRVCIPLINDAKKRSIRKATRNFKPNDSEKKSDSGVKDESFDTPTIVGDTKMKFVTSNANLPIVHDKSRSPFDPVIVSVASMMGMKESTNQEEARVAMTTHQQSPSDQPSRGDNGALSSSQSVPSSVDDTHLVVVQDRGIQVCERAQNANLRSKRTIQQAASVNQSVQNEDESNARKRPKLNENEVTKNIYTSSKLRVPAVASNGVGQRPMTRSSTVSMVQPGAPQGKAQLPSAKGSIGIPMNSNSFHNVAQKQVDSVVGDTRATLHQQPQRVIFFTTPSTPSSAIPSLNTTSKIPIASSHNAPTFMSTGTPSLERKEVLSNKTVFYPISTIIKQNQNTNSKRRSEEIPIKPKVTQEIAPRLDLAANKTPRMIDGGPERLKSSEEALSNREMIRKLLDEHEGRTRSSSYSSHNDLQVMVDCLSSELERERTLRLRLEIELRKVENQLDQERKLNERLAAMLMKR